MIRYLIDISDLGQFLTLDNGACYRVAPDDQPAAACWLPSQAVRVYPSRSKVFSVRIHNQVLGQSVKACKSASPPLP